MAKLALFGGEPIHKGDYTHTSTIGPNERRAVVDVMMTGVLSDYLASWGDKFLGGHQVQKLEARWAEYFGVTQAVAMNSATSALYAAIGAAGISPGDEVIVSPYTMIASATAAFIYGGIPVFADIDEDTFCISHQSVLERSSEHTRAVIAVDLFGHPIDVAIINSAFFAYKQPLVIEDAAQAMGATYQGRKAGKLGDIGIFSLNYHKHIHSGEGGIAVTDDDDLALRLRLIRNHAEACVEDAGVTDLTNMVGFNYRMNEIEAAIAFEQLWKLAGIVHARRENAAHLSRKLASISGITLPVTAPGCEHAWYLYAMKWDEDVHGVHRDRFVEAVRAEGVNLVPGYVKPIYFQPMYQQRIAFGRDGYPFNQARREISYERGTCPVAERMHFKELMYTNACHQDAVGAEIDDFCNAIYKVIENIEELREKGKSHES